MEEIIEMCQEAFQAIAVTVYMISLFGYILAEVM